METLLEEEKIISGLKFDKRIIQADDDPVLGCKEKGLQGFDLWTRIEQNNDSSSISIWRLTCKDEIEYFDILDDIFASVKIIN